MKRLVAALLCLLPATVVLAAPVDPDFLVRIERQAEDDLATLLDARYPVVLETLGSLYAEVDRADLSRLTAEGWKVAILDERPRSWTYLTVGLTPNSDPSVLDRLGTVVWNEENWVLWRPHQGVDLEEVHEARVFFARVPHETLRRAAPAEPLSRRPAGPQAALPLVQQMVDGATTADIDLYWTTLATNAPSGTRHSTSAGCASAASWAQGLFTGWGLDAQAMSYRSGYAPNIVATKPGALDPGAVYIVVGHLDDLPSSGTAPGADDNASGSATVLVSAKAASCYAFRKTLKFVLVTGEEQGLYGSEAYAADALVRGEDIRGVINMDMPGWQGDGIPAGENLDLNYNAASQGLAQLFAQCASDYGTGLAVNAILCPSLTASDHAPFWRGGWRAVCGITDNEGYCGQAGNYPHYHQSTDTLANCGNPAFFHKVVKTTVATIGELGEPFRIAFAKSAWGCGGSAAIVLGDRDLNTNPATAQTVVVTVASTTEGTPESVTLTEDGVNSMIFRGTIPLTTAPPVAGNGLLSVTAGDAVTASYVDALDCSGLPNVPHQAVAAIDCTPPSISNVQVTAVTESTATITWTTGEASNSRVTWGTTPPPSTNADDLATYGTSHAITLTGLAPCTTYVFGVTSADEAGNPVTSNNGGAWYSFRTAGRSNVFGPDDVEGGTGSWTATGQWHVSTCRAASATRSWKAGASDAPTCSAQYSASTNSYLTSGPIDLGGSGHGHRLRWREYRQTEAGYDWCTPQISVNGGTNWTDLLPKYAGSGGGWVSRDVDLAAWTGNQVRIRFWFQTDSGVNGEGWYVDDIDIGKAMACNATLQLQSTAVVDGCSGGGAGSGNGVIDAGEEFNLRPTLANPPNLAGEAATSVTATLTSPTAGVTIVDGTAGFPAIPAGGSAPSDLPNTTVRVDGSVACGTVLSFDLAMTSAQGSWTASFTKTVGALTAGGGSLLSEGFESGTFPPTGWSQVDVSGTAGNWTRVTATTHPAGSGPHGGTGMAMFNSYTATSGAARGSSGRRGSRSRRGRRRPPPPSGCSTTPPTPARTTVSSSRCRRTAARVGSTSAPPWRGTTGPAAGSPTPSRSPRSSASPTSGSPSSPPAATATTPTSTTSTSRTPPRRPAARPPASPRRARGRRAPPPRPAPAGTSTAPSL